MAPPRTLVLTHSRRLCDQLEHLSAGAPWMQGRELLLLVADGDTRYALELHRERHGNIPLGYLTEDETAALTAIEAGADEASVVVNPSAAFFAAFVARIELRARLRAEGRRLEKSFEHAEKLTALGTLVAGVGHEINNPLSAIMLYLDALRHRLQSAQGAPRTIDADIKSMLDDMGSAADAIAGIVRDLRVFARADEHEQAQLVDIEELIEQALRMVGRDLSHQAILERDYVHGLPKLVVPRNKLTQVLVNLLINAAHAIREVERSTHRIRISARADDDFVVLAISDTGPGIPAQSLERIFDPFFTTKREEIGTGLGLAISRSILRRIGGELSVESVHGEGATFMCCLPLPSQEMVRGAWQHTQIPATARSVHRGKLVLVIDDDARVLRSCARVLDTSHRVVVAQDGSDAIELLQSGTAPDAIILELSLPEQDGCELLAWLEEHQPALRARTLVVTSAGSSPKYAKFLATYDGAVLHKPVRGSDLLAAINQLIEP